MNKTLKLLPILQTKVPQWPQIISPGLNVLTRDSLISQASHLGHSLVFALLIIPLNLADLTAKVQRATALVFSLLARACFIHSPTLHQELQSCDPPACVDTP
jgi:hypothetical protein